MLQLKIMLYVKMWFLPLLDRIRLPFNSSWNNISKNFLPFSGTRRKDSRALTLCNNTTSTSNQIFNSSIKSLTEQSERRNHSPAEVRHTQASLIIALGQSSQLYFQLFFYKSLFLSWYWRLLRLKFETMFLNDHGDYGLPPSIALQCILTFLNTMCNVQMCMSSSFSILTSMMIGEFIFFNKIYMYYCIINYYFSVPLCLCFAHLLPFALPYLQVKSLSFNKSQ